MGLTFTQLKFMLCLLKSVIHACIIFYFPFTAMDGDSQLLPKTGAISDEWSTSLASFESLFIIVTMNIIIFTRSHTIYNWFALFALSIVPLMIIFGTSNVRRSSWMYNVIATCHQSPLFYATIVITVGTCCFSDLLI